MPPAADNPRGYFEDLDVYHFNENELLPRLGRTWHDLREVEWGRLDDDARARLGSQAIDIIRANYSPSRELSVLKEPRIGILLPFWLPVLQRAGFDVRVVGIVRDPLSSARSLAHRDGFSVAHGGMLYLMIWLEILNRVVGVVPFALVTMDDVLNHPYRALAKTAHRLGVELPGDFSERAHEFAHAYVEPSLRHHVFTNHELEACRDMAPLTVSLFWHLRHVALTGDHSETRQFIASAQATIDSIRPVFADADAQTRARDASIARLKSSVESTASSLRTAIRERDELAAALAAFQASIIWRTTGPLRWLLDSLRGLPRTVHSPAPSLTPAAGRHP
jgi:hypothetical protein